MSCVHSLPQGHQQCPRCTCLYWALQPSLPGGYCNCPGGHSTRCSCLCDWSMDRHCPQLSGCQELLLFKGDREWPAVHRSFQTQEVVGEDTQVRLCRERVWRTKTNKPFFLENRHNFGKPPSIQSVLYGGVGSQSYFLPLCLWSLQVPKPQSTLWKTGRLPLAQTIALCIVMQLADVQWMPSGEGSGAVPIVEPSQMRQHWQWLFLRIFCVAII